MSGAGRKCALLIGNANYQDSSSFPPLPCTHADARALEQVLRDPAVGQFDQVTVVLDPTAAEMRNQVGGFLSRLAEDDLGVLYISGHGHRLRETTSEFYFVAADTTLDDCERSGVSATYVNEQLEQSLAGRKVAIFDCCYSGGYTLGFVTRLAKASPEPGSLPAPRGVYVMASSGPNEQSWVDTRPSAGPQLSVFTAELVAALDTGKGDTGGDGLISVDELFHYVNQQVRQAGTHSPQAPVISADKVNKRIDLARCRVGGPVPAASRRGSSDRPPVPVPTVRAEEQPDESWQALLGYYRDCLLIGSEQWPLMEVHETSRRYACIPGHERMLSHDLDESGGIPLPDELMELASQADENTELWYGYPAIVLLKDRSGRAYPRPLFAPLLLTRVTVVQVEGGSGLKPVGTITPHPGLATHLLGETGAKQLLETYRSHWQAGMHGQMLQEIRYYLEELGLSAVQELRPTSLEPEIEVRTPVVGARNSGTLFLVRSDSSEKVNNSLLKDLDHIGTNEATVHQTALAALLDTPPQEPPRRWRPVFPQPINDGQRAVLDAAMTHRLTVATGPPGTGKSQLVANVVATAIASGQSVLVASTNNQAVDEVWNRCQKILPGAVVRTGNRVNRELEQRSLSELLTIRPPDKNIPTAVAELSCAQEEFREANRLAENKALAERSLLDIAAQRENLAAALGAPANDVSARFQSIDLTKLTKAAERAAGARFFGGWRRARFGRRVNWCGVATVAVCQAIADWARNENTWYRERTRARQLPDDHAIETALARAVERVASTSRELLKSTVHSNAVMGRDTIEALVRAASDYNRSDWGELRRCLPHVRGWATTTLSIRRMPTTPALFDLVIVDEASQCSIPQIIPVLYRGARALVIGDVMQLGPVITLQAAQEAEIRRERAIPAGTLETRQLSYHRYSAFQALQNVAGRAMLLDEHYRCHPDIAAIANTHFYGGRLTVLTDVRARSRSGLPAVAWVDVVGEATRDRGYSWFNVREAEKVSEVLTRLLRDLPQGGEIGVVTPYTGQQRLLERQWADEARVKVGTVHTFQGGEKDVIVFSLVAGRGFPVPSLNWLLRQRTLWNVAITRARSHLIVVGDRETWRIRGGVGEALSTAAEGASVQPLPTDSNPLDALLHQWLTRRASGTVSLAERRNGYVADAIVGTGSLERAVVLDHGYNGHRAPHHHLRLQLERTKLLRTTTTDASRLPAWRLFEG
ncbi:AAA domain-containing protein [Amycolatopsis sp. NPDC051903]|uniref:caspase, EACC1-associated type n=1 Tax=Amycolatopsis sp. NPDC051903 TaxID=3363936 RepID=UPI00379C5E4D